MRKILLIQFALLLSLMSHSQELDRKVADCLNTNDFFTLDYIVKENKAKISPFLKDLSMPLLQTFFNQPDSACASFQYFFTAHQNEIKPDLATNLIYLWSENLMRVGAYHKSKELIEDYLKNFSLEKQKQIKPTFNDIISYCSAYALLPASKIIYKKGNSSINIQFKKTGKRGYTLYVPIGINGQVENFVLDTGAGENVITEKFAIKHRIKILKDSILLQGNKKGYGRLGYTDSLKIGNVLYLHPTFVIVSEITPNNIPNDCAILGIPFLRLLNEISIYPQKHKLLINAEKTDFSKVKNIIIRDNQLYANGVFQNKQTQFHFDTGNVKSFLNGYYYQSNRELFKDKTKIKNIVVGGFGGLDTIPVYTVLNRKLKMGGATILLKKIEVFTNRKLTDRKYCDGTLGLDFVQMFDRVTLNFSNMTLDLFVENEISEISNNILNNGTRYAYSEAYCSGGVPNSDIKEMKMSFSKNGRVLYRKVGYQFNLCEMKWEPKISISWSKQKK